MYFFVFLACQGNFKSRLSTLDYNNFLTVLTPVGRPYNPMSLAGISGTAEQNLIEEGCRS